MKKKFLTYYEQLIKKHISIYDKDRENFLQSLYSKLYKVNLFKKNVVNKKKLRLGEIEDILSSKCKYRMITIECKENKKSIYRVIGKVSKKNGICSPFIELENCIIYFPQLRYSDLDLLKYLCEQRKIEGYKLLIASGC